MKQLFKKTIPLFAAVFISSLFFAACGKEAAIRYDLSADAGTAARYPDVFFAVISDTHAYDPELGSSGSAFEKVLLSDRKLLLDSINLLDYAIEEIIASGVSFVLISGDLTKDGELVNHRIVAEKLKKLTDANIQAYVIPGNHDINNPDAARFLGDNTENVASVSAGEFAQIYGDFGYNAAFMRDGDSLSYAVEPAEGLWLLALDACRYRENVPGKEEIVSGKISQTTADWIAEMLREAAARNKAVMVMIHHGVVEHWKGQSKLHPDYLILGYAGLSEFFASMNVRIAFTGHYHAQDIVRAEYNGKFIYDVETGSLVTAPCPIRYVQINDNAANIRTDMIVDRLYPGTDFADNAHAFVKKTVMLETANVLKRFLVSKKDTEIIADAVGDAFSAHYSGDENAALRPPLDRSRLGPWGRFVLNIQQYVLDGLWADLLPADNNARLQL